MPTLHHTVNPPHPLLQPAVKLNNAEMALAGREAEEEQAVLVELSGLVAQHAQQLRSVLSSITALDVATARGRHAAWLGATVPPRFLSAEEAVAGGAVQLPRAWHPLLLQPCLPTLPTPPLPEDAAQQLQAEPLRCALVAVEMQDWRWHQRSGDQCSEQQQQACSTKSALSMPLP